MLREHESNSAECNKVVGQQQKRERSENVKCCLTAILKGARGSVVS